MQDLNDLLRKGAKVIGLYLSAILISKSCCLSTGKTTPLEIAFGIRNTHIKQVL